MKSRVRSSTVLVHNGKLLSFLAIDPKSGQEYHFLPGGQVEPEETAPEAAERETLEETGYHAKVDEISGIDREYFFHWNGEDYDCLTVFYWATLASPVQEKVEDASYNKGHVWVPLHEIPKKFSYSAEILSAVKELIQKYQR